MPVKAAIAHRIFNLKKGEEKVVALLTAYSFFMGLAYAYFYTASTSLFVGKFETSMLPYAYVGQGVISYIVWLFFKRMQRYVSFSKLFIGGGIFLFISVVALSVEYFIKQSGVAVYALFVWYNIFLLLNGIGFWGIAAKIFNLSQAKRLFGLIGSGEILARVISFLSVPILLHSIKTADLLYLSMAGLVICLVLMPVITRYLHGQIGHAAPPATKEEKQASSIFKNRYFLLIFVLALFPLFATFYVDFIFLGQVKLQFVNAQVIGHFISLFMGTMSVAEFILKTFLSGRILTKYGLLVTLLLLPVLLLFSTTLAAVLGSIYGTAGLFFSFIILSRLFVRVVRTLFFDPSFQILYQPVPIEHRLSLQSKVEGVSKSIGFIFAGGMLLLLANTRSIGVVGYNYIFLVIIAGWIWVSYELYHEYKHLLRSVISKLSGYQKKEDKANSLRISPYLQLLEHADHKKKNIALDLFSKIMPSNYDLILIRLLPRAEPELQASILKRMKQGNMIIALPTIDRCLKDESFVIKNDLLDAQRYLLKSQHSDIGHLKELARSPLTDDRLGVAYLLAHFQNYNSYKILTELLHDPVTPVRNSALMSSGNIKKRELWPIIVRSIIDDETAYAAMHATRHVGEPLLSYLADMLNRTDLSKDSYIRIVKAIASIDSAKVDPLLRAQLNLVEPDIRNNIFTALYDRHYQFPVSEHPMIKGYIENELDTIVWLSAAILDIEPADNNADLKKSLELELRYKIGLTFRLLSMMYDANVISFFINSFDNSSHEQRAYALEVLDMTVPADMRKLVMPLLNDVPHAELIKAYEADFIQQKLSVKDRLIDIVNKDLTKINFWTKAMAIHQLATFEDIDDLLVAQMLAHNKLYSETVLWHLNRNDPYRLSTLIKRLTPVDAYRVNERVRRFKNMGRKRYLLTDIIGRLRTNEFFKNLPMFELMRLCEIGKQQFLAQGEELILTDEQDTEALYFVLSGHLHIMDDHEGMETDPSHFYWYLQHGSSRVLTLQAQADTVWIKFSASAMFELLAGNDIRIKRMVNTLNKEAVHVAAL
ncbi:hypothetical protein LLH06_09025 [Mucilaginibacter daejeonensis]|uniref:hypothetical protein n=1 Tax=Mucilaginibacter daejeonensis TaxID=398049 RepID=UPI001D170D5A|nr:hypothetical protein [Mucilaginibacter daejeonensis]UEG55103.1 hypothetical protein LLH06_09025 [Mucilaginibacter daejeonensis]